MTSIFDAIVIGGGQAGPSLAGRLAAAGLKTAIVERHLFGGTCVNTGCMPTKTLVASARAAHMARRADDFGVAVGGPVRVDMARVSERAAAVSDRSRSGLEAWLQGMANCTVIRGHARFEDAHVLRVGETRLTAPRIFLNVGGRATIPDLPGLDQVTPLTNSTIIGLDRLPEHLVVIGGSYIGLEFAQMYRRFGAQVTVIEQGPRLIGREDEDVSEAVRQILAAEGVQIRTDAACIAVSGRDGQVAVQLDCGKGPPAVTGSHLLLAVGRRPNTDDLGLEQAGIAVDRRGFIPVDEGLATAVPGIWALGECNGRGAFTHTAYNDFEIVAANLLDGEDRKVGARVPGYALFIDPPLGRAGQTESQVRAGGRRYLVATMPMSEVGRAIEKGETQGFMKLLADPETRSILGASILGTGGDEAIHGILDLMNAGQPYTVLQRAVPIHPTVSELLPTLAGALKPAA